MVKYEGKDGPEEIRNLNKFGEYLLRERSMEGNRALRNLIHKALTFYLEKDRELLRSIADEPPIDGTALEFYILEDFLAAPKTTDNSFRNCLSMKLRNRYVSSPVRRPVDELKVYVPVPKHINAREGDVPMPERIFIEHKNIHGDMTRYDIGETGFSAYTAEVDDLEVTDFDLLLSESGIFDEGVHTGLPTIDSILESSVNMAVVPQRKIIIGRPDVENL